MGRPPCCDKLNVKRGPWTAEEDAKMLAYVAAYGAGNWTLVPKKAGLNRCGKSCRLRWTNYLRPDLNHTGFTPHEEDLILRLHRVVGSRWSLIARHLPGRTDNDVKNYWNTKLRKKLTQMGIDPITHKPLSQLFTALGTIVGLSSGPVTRTAFSPPPSLLSPPNSISPPLLAEFETHTCGSARFVPYSYLIGNKEINPSSLLVNISSHDEHTTLQSYDFNGGSGGEMWGRCSGGNVVKSNMEQGGGSSLGVEDDISMDSSFCDNIFDWMDDGFHGLVA